MHSLPISARGRVVLVVLSFLCLGVLAYGASLRNDFVGFDDNILVYRNPIIRQLSLQGLRTAFTSYDPELYIPLTFLTFQVEYALVGANPGLFHLTNLLLHIGNALLVCALGYLLSCRRWVGIITGLLFLLHPLNVEAVAWIAGRKDVLSGFFALLSLDLYLQYLKKESKESEETRETNEPLSEGVLQRFLWTPWFPRNHRTPPAVWFIASGVAFLLALLAKVSVLMLPFLLILMDLWERRRLTPRVMAEKIPFFLLSFVFGLVALGGKGTRTMPAQFSLLQWLLFTSRVVTFYLQKLLVPYPLSPLYPLSAKPSLADPVYPLSVLVFLLLAVFMALSFRRRRAFASAMAAFVLGLAPSLFNLFKGNVLFLASDRYAYTPSVSLFLLAAAGSLWLWDRAGTSRVLRISLAAAGSAVVVLMGFLTFRQSLLWHDGETLFSSVLRQYPRSAIAHNNRGIALEKQGKFESALQEYRAVLAEEPGNPMQYLNIGRIYQAEGKIREAYDAYYTALRLAPSNPAVHYRLSMFFLARGMLKESREAMANAYKIDPNYVNYVVGETLHHPDDYPMLGMPR